MSLALEGRPLVFAQWITYRAIDEDPVMAVRRLLCISEHTLAFFFDPEDDEPVDPYNPAHAPPRPLGERHADLMSLPPTVDPAPVFVLRANEVCVGDPDTFAPAAVLLLVGSCLQLHIECADTRQRDELLQAMVGRTRSATSRATTTVLQCDLDEASHQQRAELERQLREARAGHDAQQRAADEQRAGLEQQLREARAGHDAQQRAADEQRAKLEASLVAATEEAERAKQLLSDRRLLEAECQLRSCEQQLASSMVELRTARVVLDAERRRTTALQRAVKADKERRRSLLLCFPDPEELGRIGLCLKRAGAVTRRISGCEQMSREFIAFVPAVERLLHECVRFAAVAQVEAVHG